MDERTIEKVLELPVAPMDVWEAISEPSQLSKWFGHRTELDLRPGGDGAMIWDNHGRYAVRVEEVDPPHRLVWSWVHEPDVQFADAPSTRVEWTLTPREDGGTTLHLFESGFLTDLHLGQNQNGWDAELGELVDLLGAT